MPFLDGGRHLTHCGNPFCGLKITESEKKDGNFWYIDENRSKYLAAQRVGMEPDWQIVHNKCPPKPENECKKCKQDCFCTCRDW
jgi:hypothetical protein